jgi:hypothetical protein
MRKRSQNGGRTVSRILIFVRSSFRANDDYRWTVCKKTVFALAKTDLESMEMYGKSILEDVMQKASINPRKWKPK